jgi:transcription elongation GreA/GreB family factor
MPSDARILSTLPDKRELAKELLALLKAALDTVERAHKATKEGATHEEARPENDKDTRALEQSYLARGQALRVEELIAAVGDLQNMLVRTFERADPVALGALVTVQQDDTQRVYFLAPHGGGSSLAGGAVQVVTPRSPLGRALLGKHVGDDCDLVLAGRTRQIELIDVA